MVNYAICFFTRVGFAPFTTTFSSTITFSISVCEGKSYIVSIIRFSKIVLSPLAPVFNSIAFLATALIAPSVISNST